MDASDTITPSDRVANLVDAMTRTEKLSLLHGSVDPEGMATGYLPGIERLDVPEVRMADGPLGVRTEEPATAFPASMALAATFDPDLAREQGRAMAREALARRQDVLLGPGMNIVRVPHCGRNFEYYSEDPILTAHLGAAMVEGIQSEDVMATPKHYVANNQETRRARVSAEVDERVLRELYLPAFHDAVDAGAGAVMTAYNRVNGTHMSEHAELVRGILKDEWGFSGFVVSDWFGTESAVRAANGGLDVEMPGGSLADQFESMGMDSDAVGEMDPEIAEGMPNVESGGLFAADLLDAVETGSVPEVRLDDMVARVLGQLERFGLLDEADRDGAIDTPEHRKLAERIATRGTVLLQNDGVLPLEDDCDVAVIGPDADAAILGGGGSSETTPFEQTAPIEGIRDRAKGTVTAEAGIPAIETKSMFDAILGADDTESGADELEPDFDAGIDAAGDADVAVVIVRDAATEAADRNALSLPGRQDELVEAVAAVNDRTVVVANVSGPVEMPWRESVDAILCGWYPGQAHGDALSAVLYGDADPAGRLPVTFGPEGTYPTAHPERFPGVDDVARYEEGLLVGYRHFDATDTEPTYPFGHGHSYAEFEYGNPRRTSDGIAVTIENTADRAGCEVVQAYIESPTAPDDLDRPPQELAGFASIDLAAGERADVELGLDERALGRYDPENGWTVDHGEFVLSIGHSSRDSRERLRFDR